MPGSNGSGNVAGKVYSLAAVSHIHDGKPYFTFSLGGPADPVYYVDLTMDGAQAIPPVVCAAYLSQQEIVVTTEPSLDGMRVKSVQVSKPP